MRKHMNQYKQLTEGQRYQISALLKVETLQKDIALILGVSPPTISRELDRNTGKRGYRPKQAHIKAERRRQAAERSIKMTVEVVNLIETGIRLDWSPEQVSGWLEKEENIRISHERIYQHVWADKRQGGELYKHLRQSHKKRKKKYGAKDKRGQIRNRVSIEERPEVVETKTRIGDREIDTVTGAPCYLTTFWDS
ncbi:IS30 family transposase, partial [Methylococcaceae bacterium CS5]